VLAVALLVVPASGTVAVTVRFDGGAPVRAL
jgi:hypothetical protein